MAFLRVRLINIKDSSELGIAMKEGVTTADSFSVVSDAIKYPTNGPHIEDFDIPANYDYIKESNILFNKDGILGYLLKCWPKGTEMATNIKFYSLIYLPSIENKILKYFTFEKGNFSETTNSPNSFIYKKSASEVDNDILIKAYYADESQKCTIKAELDNQRGVSVPGYKETVQNINYGETCTIYAPKINGYTAITKARTVTLTSRNASTLKTITFYYKKDPVEVGGQDATTDSENTYETTTTNPETALTDSNVPDYSVSNLSKWNDRSDTYGFGCYFIRYEGGEVKEIRSLPVFPQEFSDTNSAEFNATSVLGRSVAYQTYNTSSRTVSFALTLHEEVVKEGVSKYYWSKQVDINNPDTYPSSSDGTSFDESSPKYNKVREIVAQIQAACYPGYKEGAVVPPEVEFVIGNQFSIRGILTSCGATWKPPIINGNYVCCDLSIGITETTGPYSSSDVVRLKGKRGSYNA